MTRSVRGQLTITTMIGAVIAESAPAKDVAQVPKETILVVPIWRHVMIIIIPKAIRTVANLLHLPSKTVTTNDHVGQRRMATQKPTRTLQGMVSKAESPIETAAPATTLVPTENCFREKGKNARQSDTASENPHPLDDTRHLRNERQPFVPWRETQRYMRRPETGSCRERAMVATTRRNRVGRGAHRSCMK
jgi:hypothetical protein